MKPLISVPITAFLIYLSHARQSLTPLGILTATLTAFIHSAHPSPLPFSLLVVFFLAGTGVTKVKHTHKSQYTLSSTGASQFREKGAGGGAARTHNQVLANSGVASLLVLVHLWRAWGHEGEADCIPTHGSVQGILLAGIVANYASVAADTFSSELGILAGREPMLITRPWVRVPRGTNGGVTGTGLGAGVLGALIVAVASVNLMPFCAGGQAQRLGPVGRVLMVGEKEDIYRGWTLVDKLIWVLAVSCWGTLGSVLDSLLGAVLQASVVDKRTGKIVEGHGGQKVLVSSTAGQDKETKRRLVHVKTEKDADKGERDASTGKEESRRVLVGLDWLDNNQINFSMAACMSLAGMGVASWFWGIPLSSIWS